MRRILLVILIIVAVLIIVISLFLRHQVTLAWPQTDGEIQLTGLQDSVTVIRDQRGIPHIYASNSHDLFMAQGFVHAQDRFWQMEFWRRIGQGRLAELFGESQIETDRFLRTLGVTRSAQLAWEASDAETRVALEAYAEGVNVYIQQNSDHLPLEFRILGLTGVEFTPEPWTPLNTLTWTTMMSFLLGNNYDLELYNAEFYDSYGETWLRELITLNYGDRPIIVPDDVAWQPIDIALIMKRPEILGPGLLDGIGSNNWVIHGDKTGTGLPLLANDMHLGIQMPAIWYENGLHCQPVGKGCPYKVVGFSFASAPGVVVGHNERIAWGVTTAVTDVQDLYVERTNPDNPLQYEVNGQWVDFEISQEEIPVADEDEPVHITIRRTRHGPLINDVAYGSENEWAYGWQPLSLRWVALEGNRVAQSILKINQAADWDEFQEALRFWDAPTQNFVYADLEGNIGYTMPGLVPIRAQGDGLTPVPGWNDDYAWQDFIPFEDLPRAFNPSEGYIATANNRMVGDDYPYFISYHYAPGYRAQRIVDLIQSQETIDIPYIQHMHGDNANLFAEAIAPYLQALSLNRPEVAQSRDRLLTWDGQQGMDSAEAAYFEAFVYHLIPTIFEDELRDLAPSVDGSNSLKQVEKILPNPTAHWWDNIYTPETETRDDILIIALNDAYDDLLERAGQPKSWRWVDLHTATFRNESLGQSGIGLVESIFNRGPYETAGANIAINATGNSGDEESPFEVDWLPSERMIVDIADLDASLTIITTGQSGHPYHRHYDDQSEPWRLIQYGPMHWDQTQIKADAEGILTLTP